MAEITTKTPDVLALETKINEANTKIAELTKELEAEKKINKVLSAEIEALISKEGSVTTMPTVKVGKKNYEIRIPRFNHNGEIKTAADVQNDAKLASELVEVGSGVLSESI